MRVIALTDLFSSMSWGELSVGISKSPSLLLRLSIVQSQGADDAAVESDSVDLD
jgi:hypothetical protein